MNKNGVVGARKEFAGEYGLHENAENVKGKNDSETDAHVI